MKIITRYIIKELAWPFFFSLAVIMFVFITKFIVQYIGKIFGKGLPALVIFEFIYLNLAWMLALAVPMAVLVASLMAFGRLSADNEITVFRASGINLYRIIAPALLAGAFLTILMIIYNDRVLPEFNHQARMMMRSITQKKPTFSLEEGLYLQRENLNILVEQIERSGDEPADQLATEDPVDRFLGADRLNQITIFDFNARTQFQRTIIADHGYLVFDSKRAQMLFNLFNGEIHELNTTDYEEYRRIRFEKTIIHMEASDQVLSEVTAGERGDREMTIAMMRETIAERSASIAEETEKIKRESHTFLPLPEDIAGRLGDSSATVTSSSKPESNTLRTAMSKASRKAQNSLQQLSSAVNNQNYFERQIYKYEVEIYKKYSIPFACIVFILVGAPLGIRARRGSLGVSVAFSIFFFLIYWVCLIGGEDLADRQLVTPALAMWFPNILVGSFGLFITYKTVQETNFINWNRLPRALQTFFWGNDE